MVPEHPYRVLVAPESIQRVIFHPNNRDIVIGCLYSGHIVIWDMRAENTIMLQSNLSDNGHFFPIVGYGSILVVKNRVEIFNSSVLSGILTIDAEGVLCIWNSDSLVDPLISCDLRSLVRFQFFTLICRSLKDTKWTYIQPVSRLIIPKHHHYSLVVKTDN